MSQRSRRLRKTKRDAIREAVPAEIRGWLRHAYNPASPIDQRVGALVPIVARLLWKCAVLQYRLVGLGRACDSLKRRIEALERTHAH
jgi:hypothetical protein